MDEASEDAKNFQSATEGLASAEQNGRQKLSMWYCEDGERYGLALQSCYSNASALSSVRFPSPQSMTLYS